MHPGEFLSRYAARGSGQMGFGASPRRTCALQQYRARIARGNEAEGRWVLRQVAGPSSRRRRAHLSVTSLNPEMTSTVAKKTASTDDDVIVIKKYANRRLY